jgi:hypothetical protein
MPIEAKQPSSSSSSSSSSSDEPIQQLRVDTKSANANNHWLIDTPRPVDPPPPPEQQLRHYENVEAEARVTLEAAREQVLACRKRKMGGRSFMTRLGRWAIARAAYNDHQKNTEDIRASLAPRVD